MTIYCVYIRYFYIKLVLISTSKALLDNNAQGYSSGCGVRSLVFSNPPSAYLFTARGATCSGKTTLAKHLNRILPDSVIIHQDVCYSAILRFPGPIS